MNPWWTSLRFGHRTVSAAVKRRPVAFDYSSSFGMGFWAYLVWADPTPLANVNGWQWTSIIFTEPVLIGLAAAICVGQLIVALLGNAIGRKIFGVIASAAYFLFANGVGADATHQYGAAGYAALCVGNALVALRTL
jgi:hypothetical protein